MIEADKKSGKLQLKSKVGHNIFFKVQVFWEGHKNLKNHPLCFDVTKYFFLIGDF